MYHATGSNIVNPEKTLYHAGLEANRIKTADNIIDRMRHSGPGVSAFDEQALPPAEARAIAEYILATIL